MQNPMLSVCRWFALCALASVFVPSSSHGQAPRKTGVIGEYVPPRVWPTRARTYDLVHQRIALSFDTPKRLVRGEVTTRLIALQPTDSIRLDAGNLTIDAASDAAGRRLRFGFDSSRVTVRLKRRAAVGGHRGVHIALSHGAGTRALLRAAAARDLVSG
jgi:hypothetical protein